MRGVTPGDHCPQTQSGWRNGLLGLLVGLILVTGLGLRLYKLDEKSLWSDEIATIATSRGNRIDPEAFTLAGQRFDPPAPVPARIYREKALQVHDQPGWQSVSQALKANVHPPLFFWLMHQFSGQTPMPTPGRLRLPAVLFGSLSLLLIWQLARTLWANHRIGSPTQGTAFATLAMAMMALSAYQVDHAQDARQYTLLTCLALLAATAAIRLTRRIQPDTAILSQSASEHSRALIQSSAADRDQEQPVQRTFSHRSSAWNWLLLIGSLAAGLYTQYFFLVFAAFIGLYLFWQGRRDRRFLLKLVGCIGAIILLWLPWWPFFQVQLVFLKAAGHYTAGLWNPVQLPEKLWRIFCEFFLPDNKAGKVLPGVILLTALGLWLAQRPWQSAGKLYGSSSSTSADPSQSTATEGSTASIPTHFQKPQPDRPWWMPGPVLGFILLWLLILVGGQIGLDLLKHSHTATIRRYLLLASPAAYLLLAYALVSIGTLQSVSQSCWRRGLQWGLSILLLACMAGDSAHTLLRAHHSSDEFKQAAAMINQAYQPGDVVLVSKSGAMAVGMAYYLRPEIRMLGIDVPQPVALEDNSPLLRRLEPAAASSPRVWIVYSHAAPSTRLRLDRWLGNHHFQAAPSQKFPGVQVTEWRQDSNLR